MTTWFASLTFSRTLRKTGQIEHTVMGWDVSRRPGTYQIKWSLSIVRVLKPMDPGWTPRAVSCNSSWKLMGRLASAIAVECGRGTWLSYGWMCLEMGRGRGRETRDFRSDATARLGASRLGRSAALQRCQELEGNGLMQRGQCRRRGDVRGFGKVHVSPSCCRS